MRVTLLNKMGDKGLPEESICGNVPTPERNLQMHVCVFLCVSVEGVLADCKLFYILHPLDGLRMLADRHMPMFSIFFCSSQQRNLINLQPLTVLRDLTSFDHLQEMTRGCADYNEICLMQGLFMTSENARTLGADRQNHSCKDFRR